PLALIEWLPRSLGLRGSGLERGSAQARGVGMDSRMKLLKKIALYYIIYIYMISVENNQKWKVY
ncbi:hypothetical protein, partial [Chryseobacterium sp.]|uniref:hypothetical protein n=1 Tax=Chryseobacterium sp. TaxID=1871047 RepID=UPI00283BCE01